MNNTPIIQYQAEGGFVMLEAHLNDETVWLSQKHKGLLFDRDYKAVFKLFGMCLRRGSWTKIQLLQILQQLPMMAKPIRWTTTTAGESPPSATP